MNNKERQLTTSEILNHKFVKFFSLPCIEEPFNPSVYYYRCSHYDEHNHVQQLCPTRASILVLTDTNPPLAFGRCTEHQNGDLTCLPIKKVICLPWEDQPQITGKVGETK